MRKCKKALSWFLLVIMVFSACIQAPTVSFAETLQDAETEVTTEEKKTEAAVEATTEAATEKATEVTTEEKKTEVATEAATEAATEKVKEVATENDTEKVTTEEVAAEKETEFSYCEKFDEVTVKITAKKGVLPNGTTATVQPLSLEKVKKLMAKETAKENKDIIDAVMFDVTLKDADGKVIQPDGNVEITFSGLKLDKDAQEANAYRVQDGGKKVDVLKKNIDVDAKKVTFKNDHFTPVGIATYATQDQLYFGYKPLSSETFGYYYPLYVSDGGEKVAYCFNGAADWPAGRPAQENEAYHNAMSNKGYMFTKVENASAEAMNYYSKVNDANMKQKVLKVVYNGFPYNSAALYQKYNLTSEQFREVTQAAIWKYTDDTSMEVSMMKLRKLDYYPNNARWTNSMVSVYNALIGNGTQIVTPPSDFELDLFVSQTFGAANTNKYGVNIQNLLAVKINDIPTTNDNGGKVEISKINVGGEEIEGAKLEVTDKDGKVVAKWESEKDKTHEVTLQPGTYTLTEKTAPKGYEVAESITFTVDKDGKVTVKGEEADKVVMVDKYSDQKVKISKVNVGGEEIEGAKLEVTDKDGKVVAKWESEKDKTHEVTLQPGTYTLTEKTAPKGYEVAESITFTVDKDGKVTVKGEEADKVVMVDKYSGQKVKISKVNVGGEEIEGAKLEVTDKDGKVVAKWESEKDKTHEVTLQPGTYTLTEKTAPKGYEVAESITFTVDKDGKVTVKGEEADKVVMVDKYSDQKVKISKVNVGGEEIEGAKLEVTDKDGKVVAKWESEKDKTHEVTLQPGTYTLTEKTAPKGYEVAESITFTVDKDGKVTVKGEEADKVVMVDKYSDQKVKISKVNVGGEEIEGAKLEVTDKDGKVVAKWESEKDKTHEVTLQPGTYTLTEKTAPKGYEVAESITFTVDKDGKVTVKGEEADKVVMVDKYSDQKVKISKVNVGGEEIEGAKLEVTDKDGKVVAKWESEKDKTHEVTLQPGTYTLTEKTAPKGYEVAESITFTVDKDGKVTVKGEEADKVVMVDKYSDQKVKISKTDVAGDELPGAKLVVKKADGTVVEEWVSGDEVHEISVQPGTYTLVEITAPKGYEIAESITFTVDKDSKVTVDNKEVDTVTMVDKYSDGSVVIQKTDIGGKEIDGAKLTLTDKDGKTVDEWTSVEGESHKAKLQPGTYTLTEVTAPKGYEVAESVTFKVEIGGKVTIENEEAGAVVMVDKYSDQEVEISKTDIGGEEIDGAKLEVTDKDGNVVDEWTSKEGESHKAKLQPGTYTLTEKTAPKGYEVAESIEFTVDKDGKVTVGDEEVDKVVMVDEYNGTIKLNKTVVKDGEEVLVTDTFYFALFSDKELTDRVSDVKQLDLDEESNGSVLFEKLPLGTYYVAETDKDGNPVGDDFAYDVSMDKESCEVTGDEEVVEINVTNEIETTEETPGGKRYESNTETTEVTKEKDTTEKTSDRRTTTSSSRTSRGTRTGDTTNMVQYLALLGISVAGIGVLLVSRRKKEYRK